MKKGKYPASLFWAGVFTNITRMTILLMASLVLVIIGIWNDLCLYIGLGFLVIVIVTAIIEQLILRHTTLKSDNPKFKEFQQAVLDENWQDNIRKMVEQSIEEAKKNEARYLEMSNTELVSLSDDELLEAVFSRTEHQVNSFQELSDGFASLNYSQKVFFAVSYLEMEVNNGGLCQFFVNSSRIVAPYVSEYMGVIGAVEHKKLFDGFIDKNKINLADLSSFDIDAIEKFDSQLERYPFNKYDDVFYRLESLESHLKKYVRQNIKDF